MGDKAYSGPVADLSRSVVGAAIDVQKALGPWLLESAYEACLAHEPMLRGHRVERQVALPIRYKDLVVPGAFRMDLVVDSTLVVEIKVATQLIAEHEAQLLSYLRFSGHPIGLLLNFGLQPIAKRGVTRLLLTDPASFSSVSSVGSL